MRAMTRGSSLLLGLAVMAFAGVTTAVGIASGAPARFLVADGALGGTFIVAGLAAAWLRPASRAGPLLLLSGGLWFVGSYAPTGHPVLSHLGFAFEAYYDLVLAALLLILSSADQTLRPRGLVLALGSAMGARSAGRLLLQDPVRLYPDCVGCPSNPFAMWPDRSLFEAGEIVTNVAITLLSITIAVVATRRLLSAGPVARRISWPVVTAGTVAMVVATYSAIDYAWSTAAGSSPIQLAEPWSELMAWLFFAARALVPIGFLAGTLRLRSLTGPLGMFAAEVGREGPTEGFGSAIRTALGDPSVEILWPSGDGTWLTETGTSVERPEPGPGRTVTLVMSGDVTLAAITHDPALREHPELLDAVVTILRLALQNERLEAEVREQLRTVTESRARIVAAVEEERRRLERDLHDGAQQRLVGLTLRLQEARAAAEDATASPDVRHRLAEMADELAEATLELREFARGIHPAILTDEGLGPAIAGLARRSSIPVELHVDLDGRLSAPVESTAYFTVAESLTNAQRHADASQATVRLSHSGDILRVEVADDGRGGANPDRGSGLRGLSDRVRALGGDLEIESEPGQGTRVRAAIPLG